MSVNLKVGLLKRKGGHRRSDIRQRTSNVRRVTLDAAISCKKGGGVIVNMHVLIKLVISVKD